MTAKEYLSSVKILSSEICAKKRRLEVYRSLCGYKSPQLSDMPRSASPNLQSMESSVLRVLDLEAEIQKAEQKLDSMKKELRTVINSTIIGSDAVSRRQTSQANFLLVLELRYVDCLSWKDIAYQMGYTERHVQRLHGDALTYINVPEQEMRTHN